jgi:hypothetical protein
MQIPKTLRQLFLVSWDLPVRNAMELGHLLHELA